MSNAKKVVESSEEWDDDWGDAIDWKDEDFEDFEDEEEEYDDNGEVEDIGAPEVLMPETDIGRPKKKKSSRISSAGSSRPLSLSEHGSKSNGFLIIHPMVDGQKQDYSKKELKNAGFAYDNSLQGFVAPLSRKKGLLRELEGQGYGPFTFEQEASTSNGPSASAFSSTKKVKLTHSRKVYNRLLSGLQDVISGVKARYGEEASEEAVRYLLDQGAYDLLWSSNKPEEL